MSSTHLTHWVGGAPWQGSSARRSNIDNPATGEVLADIPMANHRDVADVVSSAHDAATTWGRLPIARRQAILFAFRERLHARANELAALVTAEHGKVLSDALGEVSRGIENVEYATGFAQALQGGFSPNVASGVDVHSRREPLGVVVGITPFNFPAMVPLWMCANAIAAGNAFILKPSEKNPSPALLLAELWQEAGLPAGVFSVVHGDKEAVDALIDHPEVAAISFVGSTPVARQVQLAATQANKRVQALGGAKNHLVVLPDADLALAADAAVSAAFGSAGERCMAAAVVVAVGGVGDELVRQIAERSDQIVIGDGNDPSSQMGPLITQEHRDRVASYLNVEAPASVVRDGRNKQLPARGYFLAPSIVDHVTTNMRIYTDEIFGPVLSVIRVDTFAEATELINSNQYGNGVALFTRDGGAAQRFADQIEVGMVGINVAIPVPVAHFSFGGWRNSLFGDQHMYGPEGLQFFTRAKVVTSRWPDPATSEVDLGFPRNR